MERVSWAQLRATVARQNSIFYLSLVVCALIGVLCIFGSAIWKQGATHSKEKLMMFQLGQSLPSGPTTKPLADQIGALLTEADQVWALLPDVLRDLGIALLISVFVTFSIERYASNRLRQHITYDVLSAAYAKVVPEKVYTQIADNIFRSDVYRRNWEVHIDGNKVDPQTGIAIITSTLSYVLENLNERPVPFEVRGAIDLDVPLSEGNIPRFNSFAVSDEHNNQLFDQKDVEELFKMPVRRVSS